MTGTCVAAAYKTDMIRVKVHLEAVKKEGSYSSENLKIQEKVSENWSKSL